MSDQQLGPLTAFDAVFQAEHVASIVVGEQPSSVLPAHAGLAEAVLAVDEHRCVELEGDARRVNRRCLESMVFRSWLFGVLSFLERRARDLISQDPDWRGLISEARLEKARALKDERARRGRVMGTVDALQFGDVGALAMRYDGWYEYFDVGSRRQAKKLAKQLETLRNVLAHGQDIGTHDWDTVVAVARSVLAIKEIESEATS